MKIKREKKATKEGFKLPPEKFVPKFPLLRYSLEKLKLQNQSKQQRNSVNSNNLKMLAEYHSKKNRPKSRHGKVSSVQKIRVEKFSEKDQRDEDKVRDERKTFRKSNEFKRVLLRRHGPNEESRTSSVHQDDESQYNVRFRNSKFQIRNTKYIRMSTEANTQQDNSEEQREKEMEKLMNEMKEYEKMYNEMLGKIEEMKRKKSHEKRQFSAERKIYKQQIRRLKSHNVEDMTVLEDEMQESSLEQSADLRRKIRI